jgi:hypothetical protein
MGFSWRCRILLCSTKIIQSFGLKEGQTVRGSKAPIGNDWQKIAFSATQYPFYRDKLRRHLGTGVLLGKPSDGLCAIDCDSPERVKKTLELAPLVG